MVRSKILAWSVVGVTALVLGLLLSDGIGDAPSVSALAFWIALLAAVELLPIYLGYAAELTMGDAMILAIVMLFSPEIAMLIVGIGSFDPRELSRRVPLHKALFNRSQAMLAVAAAAVPFAIFDGPFEFLPIVLAASLRLVVNLGLVAAAVATERRTRIAQVVKELVPRPVAGFALSYATLAGLGVVAALVYVRIDNGEWAVAAILIPLLFARMSIIAARRQFELSEQLSKQQTQLLAVSEKVFQEREDERGRIAADIHDSSLQSLAAASFAAGNALDLLDTGDLDRARRAISTVRSAVDDSMQALRDALTDLRRSSVGDEGLVVAVSRFADQVETLWPANIRVEASVDEDPPAAISLAALQIVQEGVTNALKHSGSEHIDVVLTQDDHALHVVVEDHGGGFTEDSDDDPAHLGLALMRERAARAGGQITVGPGNDQGTRVEAILPRAVGG
ncbi:MAG: sensor histidine kinase [Actinomycetota bacterium]|nr:sensor histidine kinase [Actinomycetota bacterium]